MAEGLFLMQRYYGSDEEFNEVDGSVLENSSDKDAFQAKKKKRKSSCKEKLNCSNEINSDVEITDESEKNSTKVGSNGLSFNTTDLKHKHQEIEKQNAYVSEDLISSVDNKPQLNRKRKKKKSGISDTRQSNEVSLLAEVNHLTDDTKKKKSKATNAESATENVNSSNGENVGKGDENFCVIGQKKSQTVGKIKPTLPKWLSNPSVIGIDLKEREIPTSELQYLDDCSKKNLNESGINFLFPVQLAVIPWLMQANQQCFLIRPSDLCVSAPTGSGKTLAFVLPIVQSLKSRVVCTVRAVVVLPVSELAIQVHKVFEKFIRGTDLKVVLLTGQKSFTAEQNALVKRGSHRIIGCADIVVTTPGRILDHIHRTEGFSLQHLRYLVIDEADRMMDDIQRGWLKQIEAAVYKDSRVSGCVCFSTGGERVSSTQSTACGFGHVNQPLQKLLFSATLSHDPEKLHTLSLYRPKLFITQEETNSDEWIGKCPLPEDLILQLVVCSAETKPIVLCHYIKKHQFKKTLCFTESIERAQRLNLVLEEMGFLQAREISSNFRPVQRKIILQQFYSGKVNILVCSDLVARGMDIEGVDCVVSYDVPPFLKTYIHRIGRTARAGKKGTAVALVTNDEFPRFKKMLTSAGMSIPTHVPINAQDLEEYVGPFQKALKVTDEKLRKLKSSKKRRKSWKKEDNKEKRNVNS